MRINLNYKAAMRISKALPENLQNLKRLLSFSTLTGKGNGSLFHRKSRKPQQSIPSNIYHTCNECPLSVFIDCCIDHNFNSLIKKGTAKKADLSRAWEMIYSEYSDNSGSTTGKALINLSKDISYHDAKLRAIGLCLKVLSHGPNRDCIHVLRDIYGYNYSFDISNPLQYASDLEQVASRTGSVMFTLQLKKAEYDRESAKVSGKPMTRESFYDILAVLFEHYHYPINPKQTTVTEFISYKKRYEAEMIAINKRSEKTKANSTANLRNV